MAEAKKRAKASLCQVSGDGVHTSIVRQIAEFSIEAVDSNYCRCKDGGENFFVLMRGCGTTMRAKVDDNEDGTYTVRYKPESSAVITIFVSLNGEQLPGSPFTATATTPTPVASLCKVRGDALTSAVARVQQYFEVQFKDALKQAAHAEELDVYVEHDAEADTLAAAPLAAPRTTDADGQAARTTVAAPAAAAPAVAIDAGGRAGSVPAAAAPSPAADASPASLRSASADMRQRSSSPVSSADAHQQNFKSKGIPRLKTNEARACVITAKSPLIVRSNKSLGSQRLGQLKPGCELTASL